MKPNATKAPRALMRAMLGAALAMASACATHRTILESAIPTSNTGRPFVHDGVIYFLRRIDQTVPTETRVGMVNEKTNAARVCAMEISTGVILWTFGEEASAMPDASDIEGGAALIAVKDGTIRKVDLKSGAEIEKSAGPLEPPPPPPSIQTESGLTIVPEPGGRIRAKRDGAEAWNVDLAAKGYESDAPGIAIEAGTLYAVCAHRKSYKTFSRIHALDAETGNELWRETIERDALSAPTVADGTLYAAGARLYAVKVGEVAAKP